MTIGSDNSTENQRNCKQLQAKSDFINYRKKTASAETYSSSLIDWFILEVIEKTSKLSLSFFSVL
jgi:hypothetical protein